MPGHDSPPVFSRGSHHRLYCGSVIRNIGADAQRAASLLMPKMMVQLSRYVLAALGLWLVCNSATDASAQANCQWYAATALRQQQENERLKCGFAGTEWSADMKAHLAWCNGVAPELWKRAAQRRDQELSACAAKKK